MLARKLNCWEYQGCERGPGGSRVGESGQCPSSTSQTLDGSNGGTNGGRACWVVSGTLCDGVAAGDYESKRNECRKCALYRRVQVEEGLDFEGADVLLSRYRGEEVTTR
ncbi:MAG: hypothetical protein U1E29_09270 [Coriobacteriia bacterium]|nr:hypothetical protein [Coriobacteriia bacterium]